MALKLEDKKAIVAEVAKKSTSALSAAVADYRGLNVNQMNDLRKKSRQSGVYIKVVRNNLAKISVKNTEFECMQNIFTGPLVLAFSQNEIGAAAKLFKNFMQNNENFKVKYLAINGELFNSDKLEEISKLPTRKESLGILCNILLSLIVKLTYTVNEIPRRAVRVLATIANGI